MLWRGDQGKKAEENCFLRDPGGLAPSPVFLKDGFKKVTLLILLDFTRCLLTYVLLALRPVDCLDERSAYLGIRIAYKRRDECFRASFTTLGAHGSSECICCRGSRCLPL